MKSTRSLVSTNKLKEIPQAILTLAALALVTFSIGRIASLKNAEAMERGSNLREINSVGFPRVKASDDDDRVLATHVEYLKFVLQIGRYTDRSTADKLAKTFEILRQKHPEAAARFLRGLRFEMEQKLELMGVSPADVTTGTPEVRAWVTRFLKTWHRECDEHLFRAVAFNASRRKRAE